MFQINEINSRNRRRMIENIREVYHACTPGQLAEGIGWYPTALTHAERIATLGNLTVSEGAAIIAALSPMTVWERNLTGAYNLVTGEPVTGLLGNNIRKATAIFEGGDPDLILKGNKVRAFWRLVATGGQEPIVCVDRHAFDICMGRATDDLTRKALERKGLYALFADCYVAAGDLLGVAPAAVQAITWTRWRETNALVGARHGQKLVIA